MNETINHRHKVTGEEDWLPYLAAASPEVLWYHLESHGDYSGTVLAIGKYEGKCLIFTGSYGSCSGCGAWGEGGEPVDLKDVLENSELLSSRTEADKHWAEITAKYIQWYSSKNHIPSPEKGFAAIKAILPE